MRLTAEQLRILNTMDVDAAMKMVAKRGFLPDTREQALAGLHKVRMQCRHLFSKKQVEESTAWLRANAFRVPGVDYDPGE